MRALYRVIPLLPHESLVALGRALGRWGYFFSRRERRVAHANLDLAYGDTLDPQEKRRIARRSFEHFGQVALEIFWGRRVTPALLERIIEIDPAQVKRVQDHLSMHKKGGLGLASHLGSWEMMNLYAGSVVPFTTLARRLRNEPLNRLVNDNRRALGSTVILHDDAARGILRTLRENRFVGIPLDQNTRPDRGGVYVNFFGKPVAASRALALFALRSGNPIFPALCVPLRGGRYRLEWGDPIPMPTEGDRDARERALTQTCISTIEGWVRAHPDGWLWMYRRWKYRPTPDPTGFPFYSKFLPEPAPSHHGVEA
jgi:KDO2-lipid IV(A) lauroyltransferase